MNKKRKSLFDQPQFAENFLQFYTNNYVPSCSSNSPVSPPPQVPGNLEFIGKTENGQPTTTLFQNPLDTCQFTQSTDSPKTSTLEPISSNVGISFPSGRDPKFTLENLNKRTPEGDPVVSDEDFLALQESVLEKLLPNGKGKGLEPLFIANPEDPASVLFSTQNGAFFVGFTIHDPNDPSLYKGPFALKLKPNELTPVGEEQSYAFGENIYLFPQNPEEPLTTIAKKASIYEYPDSQSFPNSNGSIQSGQRVMDPRFLGLQVV